MSNITEIITKDEWVTKEAQELIDYLISSGIIPNYRITDEKTREFDQRKNAIVFQNTKLLLERYRDIAWQLEYAPYELAAELNRPCNDLDEIIKALDCEMARGEKKPEYRLSSIARTERLFKAINEALAGVRAKPRIGEMYYQVLYLTYIDHDIRTIDEILDIIGIQRTQYYKLKKRAIEKLSSSLWHSMPSRQAGMLIEAAQGLN